MPSDQKQLIQYTILNPTGNITALVTSSVDIPQQPDVAAEIMRRHPDVEQVGFYAEIQADPVHVSSPEQRIQRDDTYGFSVTDGCASADNTASVHACLRMAGGEFCGNASMCAAALYMSRHVSSASCTVYLQVSGASAPVRVDLQRSPADHGFFRAGVTMPPAREVKKILFSAGGITASLPVVFLEGISHIIIEECSPFYALLQDKSSAEAAAYSWCRALGADGLGLMFLSEDQTQPSTDQVPKDIDLPQADGHGRTKSTHASGKLCHFRLTPLVYIPGSDTMFWENSCASGSAAAGIYLQKAASSPVLLSLREPGGTLTVSSDPGDASILLGGTVRIVGESTIEIERTAAE